MLIWVEFVVCAGLVILVSTQLSRFSDMLAEKTGLGRAWVGVILLAGVTSLPELVSGITAITWLDQPNLASGAVLGSCLFNLMLIAIMDLAYQPGPILAQASEGHTLSASLGILMLGTVALGVLLGPSLDAASLLGFNLLSLLIAVTYLVGSRLIARFERRRVAQVLSQEAVIHQYERYTLRQTYAGFLLSALLVVALGVWLSTIGDRLATQTGLSRSFVGNLFLATATSLPEVAASLAAVGIGAIDLAVSNVLGSNLFNLLQFAIYDLADGRANFWASLNQANGVAAIMAVMMTGIAILSLTYRASPRTPNRITWDGYLLLALYGVAMVVLYFLA
jgi:cation:H+ antiporter